MILFDPDFAQKMKTEFLQSYERLILIIQGNYKHIFTRLTEIFGDKTLSLCKQKFWKQKIESMSLSL